MMEDDRIKAALRRGEDAFWQAVAAQFPEAETGDLAPDMSHKLTATMEMAIRAWVDANLTVEDDGASLKP